MYPLNSNSKFTTKNLSQEDKIKSETSQILGGDNNCINSNYKNIKNNVDNLKVIQVGITLSNEEGEFPEDISTWQFNFKFDLK